MFALIAWLFKHVGQYSRCFFRNWLSDDTIVVGVVRMTDQIRSGHEYGLYLITYEFVTLIMDYCEGTFVGHFVFPKSFKIHINKFLKAYESKHLTNHLSVNFTLQSPICCYSFKIFPMLIYLFYTLNLHLDLKKTLNRIL